MPNPTQIDLKEAIKKGDIETLREIVAHRDHRGHPLVDINNLRGQQTALHLVIFYSKNYWPTRKNTSEVTLQLAQVLLDLRDHQNNPIIDLNKIHPNAGTALSCAIEANDLALVQEILNVRDAYGEMAVKLTLSGPHNFWSPLTRALYLNRLEMVQFLVDARNARGMPLLTRQDQENALNAADLRGVKWLVDNEATRWLKQNLQEDGFHIQGPQHQRHHLQNDENEIQGNHFLGNANGPLPERDDVEERKFFQNPQNTHRPEVTESINKSLEKLKKRYGPDFQLSAIEDELIPYIQTADKKHLQAHEKRDALNCIQRMNRLTMHRVGPNLTLNEVLGLVWRGVKDPNAVIESKHDKNKVIENRKISLVKRLAEAETEYPEVAACFVGTFNKIVESIDRLHPDVAILHGKEAVLQQSKKILKNAILKKFKERTMREQIAILKNWGSGASEAETFLKQIAQELFDVLKQKLGRLNNILNDDDLQSFTEPENLESSFFKPQGVIPNIEHLLRQLEAIDRECDSIRKTEWLSSNADTLEGVRNKIRSELENFISNRIDLETFKSRANEIIDDSMPNLHRRGQQLLKNLVLAIALLGVGYLVAGLIHKCRSGRFMFFDEKPRQAHNILQDTKRSIQSVAPSNDFEPVLSKNAS